MQNDYVKNRVINLQRSYTSIKHRYVKRSEKSLPSIVYNVSKGTLSEREVIAENTAVV